MPEDVVEPAAAHRGSWSRTRTPPARGSPPAAARGRATRRPRVAPSARADLAVVEAEHVAHHVASLFDHAGLGAPRPAWRGLSSRSRSARCSRWPMMRSSSAAGAGEQVGTKGREAIDSTFIGRATRRRSPRGRSARCAWGTSSPTTIDIGDHHDQHGGADPSPAAPCRAVP